MEQHAAWLRYYASGASYRGGACVDVALWDLIGKACGQPLYKLFGGAKDRVVPYASMIVLGTRVGKDGFLEVPTGPGLGVEIDESLIEGARSNGR